MKKGIFVAAAVLLVLGGAVFFLNPAKAHCGSCAVHSAQAAEKAPAKAAGCGGCPEAAKSGCGAQKMAAKASDAPGCSGNCGSGCASKHAAGMSRAVHQISNGVLLVYTANDDTGVEQVRNAATIGCGTSCSHGYANVAKAGHTGCSATKKALYAEAEKVHSGCKSMAPSMAGVTREVIHTPNGAIVVLTTEKRSTLQALHTWADEQDAGKPSTRASLF
jgi:hypothetical protein